MKPTLKFYTSVMNAGKTTNLLQMYHSLVEQGKKPIIIKPSTDDREGKQKGWGFIQSRVIKENRACYYIDSISNLDMNDIIEKDIVLVDEVQFFTPDDIEYLSAIVDTLNIPVICYGLKIDCYGNLFPASAKLLALADDVIDMFSFCECGERATMHIRYIDGVRDNSGDVVAVEKGNVTYKSVCRRCFKKG